MSSHLLNSLITNSGLFLFLISGHYQVDMLQLQMVIAGYCYTIIDMSLHISYISYGKSNLRVAYVHVMKGPFL
jgi:hypothetical protein